LLIDGSFVTAKTEPNDIDLVLVLPTAFDLRSNRPPLQYNLVSKRRVRQRFGFDIIGVREQTLEYEEAVAFFQQVRGERSLRKGILRIALCLHLSGRLLHHAETVTIEGRSYRMKDQIEEP
jgi:Family of unknown function (DUF6932)